MGWKISCWVGIFCEHNVLVDLTSMKIVVRVPAKPVWHHAHAQTSDEALSSTVVLDQDVVPQPFERALLRAKVVTSDMEAFAFRNVVIYFATPNRLLKNTIFVEDTIATVGETGSFYVSVGNQTSNVQKVKCGTITQLGGSSAPVRLVYHAVPLCALAHKGESDEKSDAPNEFVNRVYSEMDLNSHSKCSSSSEFEFLSSTDPSEEGLSEREIRKRTDPDLLAPIPGPESQLEEVQKLWGQTARDSLNNILTEFDDLFMKHKGDIGRCTIAKNPVELEPGATPHREGGRRMSPDKHYSAQASFLLIFVESGTRKFRCLSVECLFVESGTNDVICQFCTDKGMVVEPEILKALCCALSK